MSLSFNAITMVKNFKYLTAKYKNNSLNFHFRKWHISIEAFYTVINDVL